jgi:hypothetical protein
MRSATGNSTSKVVEYDALRHRLWILGQRCHHGATGSVVAAAACATLLTESALHASAGPRSLLALAAAGSGALLMAHDWKDRSIWFERGRGSQL